MKDLQINEQNNETEILHDALSSYLEKLKDDVANTNDGSGFGRGWPENNAEIENVKSLIASQASLK
jgi:hypothetical protein